MLSKGHVIALLNQSSEQEPSYECRQTYDHRERIMVEVARLEPARHDGHDADCPRTAVDERPIDDRLVADSP
jgi:hypothetical protein